MTQIYHHSEGDNVIKIDDFVKKSVVNFDDIDIDIA